MKVFISSLITGMEAERAAARDAISQLGHEPVMAEDFGAQPHSPQIACLDGLRKSGPVVLILGERYGAKQPSGFSATHEEYHEAKERHPVLAFVRSGSTSDPDQKKFIAEVQAWDSGLFREGFSDPDELKGLITRRLHEWIVANMAGPVNGEELLQRALALLPEENHRQANYNSAIVLAIASGPRQPILRPSDIERPEFQDELLQKALFGAHRIFSPAKPTETGIENHVLVLRHDEGAGSVQLTSEGDLVIRLPLQSAEHGMIVIHENVTSTLQRALQFGSAVLDKIDPTQRLTHVAVAATLSGNENPVWRTQAEQNASPTSFSMSMRQTGHRPVHLSPAYRARAALSHQVPQLIEDLVTLLRREWRG